MHAVNDYVLKKLTHFMGSYVCVFWRDESSVELFVLSLLTGLNLEGCSDFRIKNTWKQNVALRLSNVLM